MLAIRYLESGIYYTYKAKYTIFHNHSYQKVFAIIHIHTRARSCVFKQTLNNFFWNYYYYCDYSFIYFHWLDFYE